MSFGSPLYLIGLALIPVALVLYVRSERRPQAFAPANLLPSVAPRRAGWGGHGAGPGHRVAGRPPAPPGGGAGRPPRGRPGGGRGGPPALLVSPAKPQATIAVPTEQARVM